jgi:hypothetical protein
MSETEEYMSTEDYDATALQRAAAQIQSDVERYMAMEPEVFGALAVKQRDIVLFVLLAETLGEMRSLADLVRGYEAKALAFGDTLKSPDGLSALMSKLPIGGGLMGMMGKGF